MGSKDDEMKQIFIEESMDHLSTIETDLLRMEEGEKNIDEELVNKVFRTVHSIKGGSGFLGLTRIKSLAHEMETVLGCIRGRKLIPTAEVIHFLLLASDALEHMIYNMDESEGVDISQHISALRRLTMDITGEPSSVPRDMSGNDMSGMEEAGHKATDFAEKGTDNRAGVSMFSEETELESTQGTMPESIEITADDNSMLFCLKSSCLITARDENQEIFFIEKPLTSPENNTDKKTDYDAALQVFLKEIESYGTVLQSRVEGQYLPRGTRGAGAPFFLIVFASVLAIDEIQVLFEVDARFICQLTGETESEPESDPEPAGSSLSSRKSSDQSSCPEETRPLISSPEGGMVADRDQTPVKVTGGTETSLRVDLKLLDDLMILAGELVLSRNQLLQALSNKDTHATEIVGQRIDLITSELQQTVMFTRMQHMSRVFDRFPRLVRDLAGKMSKDVNLTMRGRQVELDKTLLEAVTDPLIHLVRNAIDHGIETPEIRLSQGKKPTGQIFLRAFHGAGKVNIEISDDGRGMDANLLADRAVSLGIITGERAREMSDKEKLHLVFLPGFSMASKVTDLSGRGVGMDVVKSNMSSIGGHVDIESQPGIGTRFMIKVPLTLAIIPSQIVVAEGERYAIPQLNLEELVRIPANRVREKIEYVGDAQVMRLREALLPLVRLTDVIGVDRTYVCDISGHRKKDQRKNIADRRSPRHEISGKISTMTAASTDLIITGSGTASATDPVSISDTPPNDRTDRRYRATSALNITVLSTGSLKYGLIVDELHDSEEIVVKPLGRHLQHCKAYAGATIMGDGRVSLILDVANIAEMAGVLPMEEEDISRLMHQTRGKASASHKKTSSLLIFMGGAAEQFAVPLNQVVRIEKIASKEIETIGQMRVVQSRGKTLPLFSVDEVIKVAPLSSLENFIVIVFECNDRDVGLLCSGPVDSVNTDKAIDEKTLKKQGVLGSVAIHDHTTMVINIVEMMHLLQPRWMQQDETRAPMPYSPQGPTILIAEDSGFFRNQIKGYIEAEGYHVIAAEDGQIALDLIKKHIDELSLVVTDLEMPNLDGFALTEKIKTDRRYAHLPVIALSTLADDANMAKGDAVGVDDYQLKLDREMLLKSIKKQIYGGR
ncbi:hybrid sensor histidine kinase/response regulator [Desulfocicer niacini]